MNQFDRRRTDRRCTADRRASDRRASDDRQKPTCPKCGTAKIAFTAGVTSDTDQLSLFRCEVCAFRFSVAGIAHTWHEPDRRQPTGLA